MTCGERRPEAIGMDGPEKRGKEVKGSIFTEKEKK